MKGVQQTEQAVGRLELDRKQRAQIGAQSMNEKNEDIGWVVLLFELGGDGDEVFSPTEP
jgi:hypothetical protein|tara:strand:- start:539 stop:715 length:177 start_codon:yes stop_codon:yes gene_type:complete